MLNLTKFNQIHAVAQKMLNGRSIVAEYTPKNTDSVLVQSGFAWRHCSTALFTAAGVICEEVRDEYPEQIAQAAKENMLQRDSNTFSAMYRPLLVSSMVDSEASIRSLLSLRSGGAAGDQGIEQALTLGALSAFPLCVYLVYSGVELVEPTQSYDLSIDKAATAKSTILGILNQDG